MSVHLPVILPPVVSEDLFIAHVPGCGRDHPTELTFTSEVESPCPVCYKDRCFEDVHVYRALKEAGHIKVVKFELRRRITDLPTCRMHEIYYEGVCPICNRHVRILSLLSVLFYGEPCSFSVE